MSQVRRDLQGSLSLIPNRPNRRHHLATQVLYSKTETDSRLANFRCIQTLSTYSLYFLLSEMASHTGFTFINSSQSERHGDSKSCASCFDL